MAAAVQSADSSHPFHDQHGDGLSAGSSSISFLTDRSVPPFPDGARIGRLMRRYIYAAVSQGVMQVAIIVVMARFVTGL